MKEIETEFIQKVIDIMNNNELSECTLEEDGQSLYIKTDGSGAVFDIKQKNVSPRTDESAAKQEKEKKKIVPVVSNMIGLFFIKPSPDGKPFVETGSKVKKGQQLCIIETIKLMNKITAEVSGTIKEICIEDSRPVEYGQVMMYIEQD